MLIHYIITFIAPYEFGETSMPQTLFPFRLNAFSSLATMAAILAAGGPAAAEDIPASDYHAAAPAEIIVTAPFERALGASLSGVSVLSGTTLDTQLKPTLGETLAHQPGVSATSFGPNASRPILRGFQGDRVRILTDGIGSFDVSNSSVDHAVVINPLTADRIEVLRGPSALLYGSSAIGGVVNVLDSRIPRRAPDEPVHIDATAAYGSAANERAIAGSASAPLTGQFVVHLDGSWQRTDDLDTGAGKLPNTAARSWDVAGGAAWIGNNANLGVSVARYDSLYGVPIRLSSPDPEQVRLDVRQTRADLRGEVKTGGIFEKVSVRAGYADYTHDELEEDGAVGTTFSAESYEGRLELVQARRGGWQGAVGAQLLSRDVTIVGEEKFLPRNRTRQIGLFTLQEFAIGPATAEVGGRWEHSRVSAEADADLGNPAFKRNFDAFSGSFGASVPVAEGWRAGLNFAHSERAPTADELFANGPHAGTQAYELGDPTLSREKSNGIELTLRGKGDGYSFSLAAYHNWFSNYIYQAQVDQGICETAASPREVEFPCFAMGQGHARHYGFEVEGSLRLAKIGNYDIVADALADYVHATIRSEGPAPRIPPLRVLGGLSARSERIDGRIELEWVDRQDRVTNFETATRGYTMVNASLAFRPFPDRQTSITLSANNIFDVVARRHASFLKDDAPLAGRDIRVGLRLAL